MPLSFNLGSNEERVGVTVHGYERAATGEYYDDNWLTITVEARAGAFSGGFDASFMTQDFVRFREQLQRLYETLQGEAQFSTLENQLSIRVAGNGRGEITVTGTASDKPGIGNTLTFGFIVDQTYLVSMLKELGEVIAAFPVRIA